MSVETINDFVKNFSNKKKLTFEKDELIYLEGNPAEGVFYIVSGFVKCIEMKKPNTGAILYLFNQGEIMGINEVLNGEANSTRAVANSNVETYFIPKEDFIKRMEDDSEFSFMIMQFLCEKINFIEEKIISKLDKSITERLAEFIVILARDHGVDKNRYLRVELSKTDLANLIGTTKINLCKKISEFKKNGWIDLKDGKIKIINFDTLKEFSGLQM